MLKIISVTAIVLLLLNGCTTQSNPSFGQNFDHNKAAKTRVSLGLTYLKNGNFSQAKYNLDKALEFAPRSADANFAMAYYYQSVSELEQAEESYQYAMDLDPKNANIANSYGAFLCQNGDYEKAKKYFLKAVNTSSYISSAETYENLALCSQNQGQPEDTIQYLRSAVNHQPGRASSLYLLAQTLGDVKQWPEAKEILRRYEKISQVSPQSLLLAMKIESGLGNVTASKGYLDMLKMIFPNDPITKSLLIEQRSSSDVVSKKTQTESFANVDQNTPNPIEKPLTTLPLANSVTVINNPTVIGKNVEQKTHIMTADDVTVAEQLTDELTQVDSEILDTPEFHIVAKGENLYRISLLYNIKMQRLIDWNGLADASAIFDGKKLSLMAPGDVE